MLPGICNNMSETLAHAEGMRRRTKPQKGGHKEEAAQPHTTRHPVRGTHAALCVLCRAPALSVSRLCVGPRRSGPGVFCVGPRRSLSRAPALSVSRPGAVCVGPRRFLYWVLALSVSGPGALSVSGSVSDPGALCLGPRRSLCRGPALSVSGPGALCLGPQRSLCRGPVSGPSVFCVGPRRSLSRAPALSVSGPGASVSGPGVFCVGPRRSLSRGLALSVSGSVSDPLSVSGPDALCVGARRSLCWAPASGPGALCLGPQRFLCRRAPAFFVPGPVALCVGARRCLCRALCRGPALSRCLCRDVCRARRFPCWAPTLSVSGPGAVALALSLSCRALCWALSGFLALSVSGRGPAVSASGSSGSARPLVHPHVTCPVRRPLNCDPRVIHLVRRAQLRSSCHPSGSMAQLRSARHL